MSPKLRALLVAVPVLVIAGVAYFIPKASTNLADLVDAGVRQDCNFRKIACDFFVDGGYDSREFVLANCPSDDGGKPTRIIPRGIARLAEDWGVHDLQSQCEDLGPVAAAQWSGGAPSQRAFRCACHQLDAGSCLRADGGELPAGTVERGASGAGCRGTPCSEVFGFPSLRCD